MPEGRAGSIKIKLANKGEIDGLMDEARLQGLRLRDLTTWQRIYYKAHRRAGSRGDGRVRTRPLLARPHLALRRRHRVPASASPQVVPAPMCRGGCRSRGGVHRLALLAATC